MKEHVDFSYWNDKLEEINLSCESNSIAKLKQSNLPIGLKKLNITLYNKENEDIEQYKEIILKNIKIPFECVFNLKLIN